MKDHCSAIDVLLNSEERGEVFNIGSGEEKTVLEIASLILSTLNKPESLIEHVEDRAGHVERHAVDTSKIRDRLSWKPDHEFDQAMVETIQWYKDNKEWWHPIKSGEFKEYYEKQYDRG